MPEEKMKKVNVSERADLSGKVFCGKRSDDFVQDTIFRIGRLRDCVEKTGMQLANTMSKSLFMKKDNSGGNNV
jgi:hypothetical protein